MAQLIARAQEMEMEMVSGSRPIWWQPEHLAALPSQAGLQLVAELRLPPTPATESAPAHRAQMVFAARRPS